MTNKGFVLVVDVMIALIMLILLINITTYSETNDYKEYEKIMITQQINDLLITSQQLNLEEKEIVKNAEALFENRQLTLTINNKKTNINQNIGYSEKTSNSITYINSSNKEIYMEIVVYY